MSSPQQPLTQTLIPIAQILGITGSAILSGLIGAMSWVTIPTLVLLPPAQAAKVWKRTYQIGISTAPPLAITCASCFGFLASQSSNLQGLYPHLVLDPTSPQALYTAAALCIPSIIPYTLAVMKPTNDLLMSKAGDEKSVGDADTSRLLVKWQGLNGWRAVMVFLGSALGTGALVVRGRV